MGALDSKGGSRAVALSGLAAMSRPQRRTLFFTALLYALSCFPYRGTVSTVLPSIVLDLNCSRAEMGGVLSMGALTYVFAKPTALALSDSAPPRWMLVCAIGLSGIVFVCIGMAPSVRWMQFYMVMLHIVHAPNWSGVAGLLCAWFPPASRGLPYSIVSSQINLVSALVPVVTSVLAAHLGGWRGAFVALGLTTTLMSIVCAPFIRMPDRDMVPKSQAHPQRQVSVEPAVSSGTETRNRRFLGRVPSLRLDDVFSKPVGCCLMIAMASMFAFMLRFSVEFWISSYFVDTLGEAAAKRMVIVFILLWQVGGFVGTLVAGPVTDRLGGDRLPTALAFSLTGVLAFALWRSNAIFAVCAAGFVGGFGAFGNRVLFMLAIRQAVPQKWGGRAEALNFLFAEFGGVLAGWPLVTLLENIGDGRMSSLRLIIVAVAAAQSVCVLLAWSLSKERGLFVSSTSPKLKCKHRITPRSTPRLPSRRTCAVTVVKVTCQDEARCAP